jgi:hypothetical protein
VQRGIEQVVPVLDHVAPPAVEVRVPPPVDQMPLGVELRVRPHRVDTVDDDTGDHRLVGVA